MVINIYVKHQDRINFTMPCQRVTRRLAAFDLFANSFNGISGYRASRFSLYMNAIDIKAPKTIRHITRGEFHGTVAPPNSRPRSSIRTKPIIERLPNQSIAFRPSIIGVFGLWTSRYIKSKMKVAPEIGRLIQKFPAQCRVSNCSNKIC
jgi:hypothetical protein